MSSSEILAAVADLDAAVLDAQKRLDDGTWQLSDAEIIELTRRHHALLARVQSIGLGLVREIETRGIGTATGATSTQAYLSRTLRISPQLAKETTTVADALVTRYPDTGVKLADGAICYEQAATIVSMCEHLPRKATAADRSAAERILLGHTGHLNAFDLKKLSKALDNGIDPDGTEDRETAARDRRRATVRDNHDGTETLVWRDRDEVMALVKAALVELAAPAPSDDGVRDERNAEQRRADVMRDLLTLATRHGDLPRSRGERPQLRITFSAEALRAGTGFGRAETGEQICFAAIRRIACDAGILAIVLDQYGVPLNVGRTHRSVTPAIWKALVARDTGCVFPGCTRPAAMCDAHHLLWWEDGGETSLDNTGLLCGGHHDEVHHRGWTIELGPDRKPRLRPPPWVDIDQPWLRNTYWDPPPDLTLWFETAPEPAGDPGPVPVASSEICPQPGQVGRLPR